MLGEPTRKSPANCSPAELAQFCALVREGAQVRSDRLEERVGRARWLVFLHDDRTLVGIAAIKLPDPGYRERVFRSAGQSHLAHRYELELGYVNVAKSYRSKGYSHDLVRVALDGFDITPLFATTREERMLSPLSRARFTRVGDAYASDEEGKNVSLFVRHPR